MNTYIEKYTMPYYDIPSKAYNNIILKEPHESGDVIFNDNENWLILNSDFIEENKDIYPKDYYVLVVNLKYVSLFSSHQKDLDIKYKDLGIRLINKIDNHIYLYELEKEKTDENSEITTLSSQIDYVTISFKNNGMYDERAINRPILRKKEQSWDTKIIGVITEVNEETVTGVIYADIVPKINNGYVCSVELKEKR